MTYMDGYSQGRRDAAEAIRRLRARTWREWFLRRAYSKVAERGLASKHCRRNYDDPCYCEVCTRG